MLLVSLSRRLGPSPHVFRKFTTPSTPTGAPSLTILDFPEQKVFGGTESLQPFLQQLHKLHPPPSRPLLVSDKGIAALGIIDTITKQLTTQGYSPVVFDNSTPNPSVQDVKSIANLFLQSNCTFCIGVGGGGPLDAMKGGMALVAKKNVETDFSVDKMGSAFISEELKPFLPKMTPQYSQAVPLMAAIPTTAGTGSEGGKSAVIIDEKGAKLVFGHPVFFPKFVALVPQFTSKMPPQLTAATGIDALFHLLEAFFVTEAAAIADGLDQGGITRCDGFALDGTRLVAEYLPRAFRDGSDLTARYHMQVAALFGAKAFRKGDLGGVHATAHAVGAYYHIHHGTAIARMAVPVLQHNEERADAELKKKFGIIQKIFSENGISNEKTLAETIRKFLGLFKLELGLSGLQVTEKEIGILTEMATKDGCQTNPVKLSEEHYKSIFLDAWKIK